MSTVEHDEVLPAVVVEVGEDRVGVVRTVINGIRGRKAGLARELRDARFPVQMKAGERAVEERIPLPVGVVDGRQARRFRSLLKLEPAKILPKAAAHILDARRPTYVAGASGKDVRQAIVVHVGHGNVGQAGGLRVGGGFVKLFFAVVAQARLGSEAVAGHLLELQRAGFNKQILPAEQALPIFAWRERQQRLAHVHVKALNQVKVTVVVEVAKVNVRTGLVLGAVVVEAAKVWHKIGAANVLKLAILEPRPIRLEHIQARVRQPAHGVANVVAADGDVEPAIAVHIADGRLAVVGLFILDAHLR